MRTEIKVEVNKSVFQRLLNQNFKTESEISANANIKSKC
jgi:hypothetical protein